MGWIERVRGIMFIGMNDYILLMYNKDVSTAGEFPVEEGKRWSTDVCCTVLSSIFALTLFILACVFFNSSNLNSAYFAGSIGGQVCSPQLVFIDDITNPKNQRCVQECPNGYYNTDGVCWPNNPQQSMLYDRNPSTSALKDYRNFKSAMVWTVLLALGLGGLWFMLSQLIPKVLPVAAAVLAAGTLIIIGILTCVLHSSFFSANQGLKIAFLVVVFVLALIIACMWIFYPKAMRLQAIFLEYAKRFFVENYYVLIYVPIFMLLTVGLIALCLFQHCAFSSKTHSNNNFFDFSNPGLLGWLNIAEFIWGLQFLRDSMHFILSAISVDWYWGKKSSWYTPIKRLFTKNWGSVASGSFVNAFFELPTLIIELFTCHKGTCCDKAGTACDNNCCDYVLSLVRTDSYTYMNLSGIPYCNSAVECTKICHYNNQFVGHFNPIKHYRFITQVFVVSLGSLFGFVFVNIRLNTVSFWHVFTIILIVHAVSCWFIDTGADIAQAVSTNFFVEHYESHEYEFMQKAIPSFRKEVEHHSKNHTDGNC